MPLVHSSSPQAFKTNVRTLMHEVGKSPHVHSREQALAIAYATKRRAGKAGGGGTDQHDIPEDLSIPKFLQRQSPPKKQFGGMAGLSPGWIEKQEARGMTHTGPIMSAVAGRTDHHAINVPSGSYVLPAAHVSALGQGNTMNGFAVLNRMFGGSPYGGSPMRIAHGAGAPRPQFPRMAGLGGVPGLRSDVGGARGEGGGPVPIMAAGGEYVLSPDQVRMVGKGDLDTGHRILDHWVKTTHKKLAKTAANLPPPAKT